MATQVTSKPTDLDYSLQQVKEKGDDPLQQVKEKGKDTNPSIPPDSPSSTYAERVADLAHHAGRVENQLPKGLWNLLHASSREVHKLATQDPFLKNLISGEMACSKAYVIYLCNLYSLHQPLEQAQNKIIGRYGTCSFVLPKLYRSQLLLDDIQLWSFFNATGPKFADQKKDSAEFAENIQFYTQACVRQFVDDLNILIKEDPIYAIGAMYALYGTIMSGGQSVKKGVKPAFETRLKDHIETYQKGEEFDEPETHLRKTILEEVIQNPAHIETYVEKSVSFFDLDPTFKATWHQALDRVPEELKLEGERKKQFETKVIALTKKSIEIIPQTIASFQENLRFGRI
jgi:hypothetical protein